MDFINDGLQDYELFDDAPFWNLPEDAFDIGSHNVDPCNSNLSPDEVRLLPCDSCKYPKVCQCGDKTPKEVKDQTLEENGPYLTMNI